MSPVKSSVLGVPAASGRGLLRVLTSLLGGVLRAERGMLTRREADEAKVRREVEGKAQAAQATSCEVDARRDCMLGGATRAGEVERASGTTEERELPLGEEGGDEDN